MRTTWDRIRHAISFEILGLLLVTPLGAWVFDKPLHEIGVISLVGATLATFWNYAFNLAFDHAMARLRGRVQKTPLIRLVHVVLFELGLLVLLMPFIAWYLGISFMDALLMDISFALFYMVYAFCFNWAYDLVFPIPELKTPVASNA
ncbi:PACE efflux transporter [Devosia rhodophyticola]|uniref:PACE efflux transporter n=1 Tax=Devosia rhodophyticola TaxID=3026423 RepID=A0ABY7YUS8_9HYPH|nr:PACE efflux transporter [Devosia rhodophyticola]WDR04858.1 PACE efflux transporter [Devosia rhodophyticola]